MMIKMLKYSRYMKISQILEMSYKYMLVCVRAHVCLQVLCLRLGGWWLVVLSHALRFTFKYCHGFMHGGTPPPPSPPPLPPPPPPLPLPPPPLPPPPPPPCLGWRLRHGRRQRHSPWHLSRDLYIGCVLIYRMCSLELTLSTSFAGKGTACGISAIFFLGKGTACGSSASHGPGHLRVHCIIWRRTHNQKGAILCT